MAKDSDFFDPDEVGEDELVNVEKIKAWNLTGKPATSFKLDQIKLIEVTSRDGMESLKEMFENIKDIKTRKQPIKISHAREVARNFLFDFEEELGKSSKVFVDDVLMFYGIAISGLYVTVYGLLEIEGKNVFLMSF